MVILPNVSIVSAGACQRLNIVRKRLNIARTFSLTDFGRFTGRRFFCPRFFTGRVRFPFTTRVFRSPLSFICPTSLVPSDREARGHAFSPALYATRLIERLNA
jgi:hypothetical protein